MGWWKISTADLAEVGLKPTSDDLSRKAADLLEWVWTNTVLPYWPTRRRIIEADIAARTTRLGRGGWTEALSDMRPGTRWLGDGRLQINALDRPPREVPGGARLFFVPITPGTGGWVAWDEPHRYALMYQCSGVLAGNGDRAAAPETLAALLGPARATILTLLGTPKTTTQLVALTGQRLGSVGRHLRILWAAGLLERHRVGRSVLYRQSPAGDLLVRIQNEAGYPARPLLLFFNVSMPSSMPGWPSSASAKAAHLPRPCWRSEHGRHRSSTRPYIRIVRQPGINID